MPEEAQSPRGPERKSPEMQKTDGLTLKAEDAFDKVKNMSPKNRKRLGVSYSDKIDPRTNEIKKEVTITRPGERVTPRGLVLRAVSESDTPNETAYTVIDQYRRPQNATDLDNIFAWSSTDPLHRQERKPDDDITFDLPAVTHEFSLVDRKLDLLLELENNLDNSESSARTLLGKLSPRRALEALANRRKSQKDERNGHGQPENNGDQFPGNGRTGYRDTLEPPEDGEYGIDNQYGKYYRNSDLHHVAEAGEYGEYDDEGLHHADELADMSDSAFEKYLRTIDLPEARDEERLLRERRQEDSRRASMSEKDDYDYSGEYGEYSEYDAQEIDLLDDYDSRREERFLRAMRRERDRISAEMQPTIPPTEAANVFKRAWEKTFSTANRTIAGAVTTATVGAGTVITGTDMNGVESVGLEVGGLSLMGLGMALTARLLRKL